MHFHEPDLMKAVHFLTGGAFFWPVRSGGWRYRNAPFLPFKAMVVQRQVSEWNDRLVRMLKGSRSANVTTAP